MATAAGFSSYGVGSENKWNFETMTSTRAISTSTQQHLQKVYLTLFGALLVASLGVYSHLALGLGGMISFVGTLGCLMWLNGIPATFDNEAYRLKVLLGMCFFQGCSIGPLVSLALDTDAGIVASALLGSAAIFGCFSGAAFFAKRREYLFLGGVLSSAISIMAVLRLASFFFGGSATLFHLELYGGLLVFVGYVIFDTQVIIEKAERGIKDYVRDAMELFLDFVAIFVRLLVILMKNKGERSRREEKRRRE